MLEVLPRPAGALGGVHVGSADYSIWRPWNGIGPGLDLWRKWIEPEIVFLLLNYVFANNDG
ncbi:hypothetical protein [Collimonas sp.]|jgi:hypothetical protein|uniref:hypothetical protein n=1 Tax=Collimonas sp. TaxID=1963772 RepID=UPI002C089AC5|nr:hypothetical protein [Collimonas sp.]HWX00170.1 hypothetical protein [Collimonas sp.]